MTEVGSDSPRAAALTWWHSASDRRLFVYIFVPFFVLYLGTANRDLPYHIDAATNVYTAWTIGTTGSPILQQHAVLAEPENFSTFGWVVESERGAVSQYPPGTALLAAPLYAVFARTVNDVSLVAENAPGAEPVTLPVPSLLPAAIVAAAVSAATVAVLAHILRDTGFDARTGLATVAVVGLGTGLWTVAADALWQHGPNSLLVSLGVRFAIKERWIPAGLSFGALFLTRAPVVLVGIAFGVDLLIRRRWVRATHFALAAAPGAVLLLAYNSWLFDSQAIAGGYGGGFEDHVIETAGPGYLANIGSALVHSQYGLFVWSPIVLISLVGIIVLRGNVPAAVRTAAIGGLAYLLLQLMANRASGGEGFTYYRYPIETLVVAAPWLAIGARRIWDNGVIGRVAVIGTAGFSVIAHALGAV